MTMTERRSPKPYGDVEYADPKNGKYPIDTEAHIRAAWAYINMPKNAATYPLNGVTLESVKAKIRAAMKRIGADVSDDGHAAARDPGWEQRRRRWASALVGQRARRSLELASGNVECRARPDGTGGTYFEFTGYAATFNQPFEMWDKWGDPYEEDVWDMAFAETLGRADLDTPFLVGHNDADIPMARTRSGTLRLATDTHGLLAHAPDLDGRNDQVRRLASAVERGDCDEMSIGFVTRGQEWSDDWAKRHLTSIDLHRGDVSVVAVAANPHTRGASMVAFPAESLSRQAASARAAANQAASADGTHPPFTGTHAHPHPAYGAPGSGPHDHAHSHDGDNDHHHMHAALAVADAGDLSARGPRERRGNPVEQDFGDASDYNVYIPASHGPMTGPHSHAHPGDAEGHAHPHMHYGGDAGAEHGHGHLYDMAGRARLDDSDWGGDALVRLDEAGIPGQVEEQGAAASLALKRRRLELLMLRGH